MAEKPQISKAEVQKKISDKVSEVLKEIQSTHALPKGEKIDLHPQGAAWEVSYKT
jgi:hypothetical protein